MDANKESSAHSEPPLAAERRRTPRLSAEFDVQLDILISEDTVQPPSIPGHCFDISRWGMRVSISELTRRMYHKLIVRKRDIRVRFRLPELSETFEITGKGVWIDYHNDCNANRVGPCQFGISFWNEGAEKLETYAKLVEKNFDSDSS